MLPARIDLAGAVLVAIAAVGVSMSHNARTKGARWYAEAAQYNRSLTSFLADHRDALRGKTVAVYGVTGLSPWSNSAGDWLTQHVGAPVAWRVHVPRQDIFYTFGRLAHGQVTVQPETPCADAPADLVHIAFDAAGRGSIVRNCEAALAHAHPLPTLDAWGPKTVTQAQAAAGFNMYFTGANLGAAVDVSIGGKPLPMVRARQGRLMTTTVPPRAASNGAVRFSVDHRGRSVMQGEVAITAP